MKLKPATLFLITTALILFSGILTRSQTIDIPFNATYLVIGYLHLAIIASVLSVLISLVYLGLESVERPVKLKTGYWHFGLFATGLLFLVMSIVRSTPAGFYSISDLYSGRTYITAAMVLTGIILLLTSVMIFLYGLAKALWRIKQ